MVPCTLSLPRWKSRVCPEWSPPRSKNDAATKEPSTKSEVIPPTVPFIPIQLSPCFDALLHSLTEKSGKMMINKSRKVIPMIEILGKHLKKKSCHFSGSPRRPIHSVREFPRHAIRWDFVFGRAVLVGRKGLASPLRSSQQVIETPWKKDGKSTSRRPWWLAFKNLNDFGFKWF